MNCYIVDIRKDEKECKKQVVLGKDGKLKFAVITIMNVNKAR